MDAIFILYLLSPLILTGLFIFVLVLYLKARSKIKAYQAIIENPQLSDSQKIDSMQQLAQNQPVVIQGNGVYDVVVVGTSHRQKKLAKIAGPKAEDSFNLELNATLEYDNSNPHDPNAIRVLISGRHIGYLSRDNAISYRKKMHKIGNSGRDVICNCRIVGGWKFIDYRGKKDEGSYGVRLDLPWTSL